MYQVPEIEDGRLRWCAEWGEYLLDWARYNRKHIVSLGDFITDREFGAIHGRITAFRQIGDWLVEQGIAKWLDTSKRRLRIRWRSTEEWADVVYAWAIDAGETRLDPRTLTIQHPELEFSTLPEQELRDVFQRLVDEKLAEWIDRGRCAIILRL